MTVIEYRNKYSDKKRHLFIIGDREIRICDGLESELCALAPTRHSQGKPCKLCEAILAAMLDNGSVYKRGDKIIVKGSK